MVPNRYVPVTPGGPSAVFLPVFLTLLVESRPTLVVLRPVLVGSICALPNGY